MRRYFTLNHIHTTVRIALFVCLLFLTPIHLSQYQEKTSVGDIGHGVATNTHLATISLSIARGAGPADPCEQNGVSLFQCAGIRMLEVAAFVTHFGGKILNFAMQELVIGMGEMLRRDSGLGKTINDVWTVIRDICNLVFIFGFIYAGFMTILGAQDRQTKSILSSIIIGALLINFSLFFAKAIIDFSNFTAYQIYSAMIPNALTDPNAWRAPGISDAFADKLGILSLYNTADPTTLSNLAKGAGFWFFVMATLMLLVAGFVLAAGGILLITRFIALVFYMIFSPILFAATVFPATSSYSSKLWGDLISHSFFAPVYLLLIFLSLKILEGLSLSIGGSADNSLSKGLTKPTEAFSTVAYFVIVIMFIIGALVISKKMGIKGGDMAVKFGGNLKSRGQKMLLNTGKTAINMPLYPFKAATRAAVGGASRRALEAFDSWQARPEGQQGGVGRFTRAAIRATDADANIRAGLTAGTQVKAGLGRSYQQVRDYQGERNRRINQTQATDLRHTTFEDALETIADADATTQNLTDAIRDLGNTIRNMTDGERSELEFQELNTHQVAVNLSDKHIESLEKSNKFSAQQIQQLRNTRTVARTNIAQYGAPIATVDQNGNVTGHDNRLNPADPQIAPFVETQRQNLLSGNMDVVGGLPHAIFAQREMARYITPAMVEARMRAGSTDPQLRAIARNIDDYLHDNPPPPQSLRDAWERWSQTAIGAQLGLSFP